MKAKWLMFMFGAKTFIGTLAGNKLSVDKMGNKTPSGVHVRYIIVVDLKCYFCLSWEISVHPSPLSFSADVSQPELLTAIATVADDAYFNAKTRIFINCSLS